IAQRKAAASHLLITPSVCIAECHAWPRVPDFGRLRRSQSLASRALLHTFCGPPVPAYTLYGVPVHDGAHGAWAVERRDTKCRRRDRTIMGRYRNTAQENQRVYALQEHRIRYLVLLRDRVA